MGSGTEVYLQPTDGMFHCPCSFSLLLMLLVLLVVVMVVVVPPPQCAPSGVHPEGQGRGQATSAPCSL